MANNLVPGGARPGTFMTRRSRMVRIEKTVLHDRPLEPGQTTPIKDTLWQGTLFMMDGRTVDTIKYWEPSGALASMNGVATPDDLVTLVSEDPQPAPPPKPAAQIEQSEPKAEPAAAAQTATESKQSKNKAA